MSAFLLQTLEQPQAPLAVAAWNCICVTVLFKKFRVYVIAGRESAVGTDRVLIPCHGLPEFNVIRTVPYCGQALFLQVSEHHRIDIFFPS